MKLQMMMTVAGIGVICVVTTARAETPPTSWAVNGEVERPLSPDTPLPPEALPPPDTHPEIEGSLSRYPTAMSRLGEALLMGAGYEAFTYSDIKAMTGGGGSWDARVVVGTRKYIGLEAGYVGAARSIQGAGLPANTLLVSNGVEGAVRINMPLVQGPTLLEPFGFVGLGWQRYDLTQSNSSSGLAGADDVMSVPFGGGVELTHRMLVLDARFTYRQTYLNNLLRTDGGRLNTWGVGGSVGVEF